LRERIEEKEVKGEERMNLFFMFVVFLWVVLVLRIVVWLHGSKGVF
jgi:hypothetical protein